jgi:hypothetical protein
VKLTLFYTFYTFWHNVTGNEVFKRSANSDGMPKNIQ